MLNIDKTRSRNRSKKSNGKTVEEKKHLGRIAGLPCCVCGLEEVEVHHIRTGQGMSQRSSHYSTLPLCTRHHRGQQGIHTLGTKIWQAKYGTEIQLLEKVRMIINDYEKTNASP